MSGVVEFRNGDASCVHYTKGGYYELVITKCGEMGTHRFKSFGELEKHLIACYGFTIPMVEELKEKTVIWDK